METAHSEAAADGPPAQPREDMGHGACCDCLRLVHDAVYVAGADGRIVWVNPAFEHLTGYTRDEAAGLTVSDLQDNLEDARALERVDEARRRGVDWQGELACLTRDGRRIRTSQSIAWTGGRSIVAMRDLTDIDVLVLAAEQAQDAKRDFTSMLSHELRTPISAIKEAVDLTADGLLGPLTARQSEFLGLAQRNVARLSDVVEKLLSFALLERRSLGLNMQAADLNETAASAVERFEKMRASSEGPVIRVRRSAGDVKVRMSRQAVSQIIANFLDNAARYSDRGEIDVVVERMGQEAAVTVSDRGSGIRAEDLGRVFEPYFQVDSGPGRRVGGVGVGLAICRRLASEQGGRVWATSSDGGGSAFHFALPLE